MIKYALNPKPDKSVKVYGRGLRISRKNSTEVCRAISGKPLPKAMALVQRLVDGKQNLDGKFYTAASSEILDLLKSAQANTESKGLDAERMLVRASAHQGFRFYRPRRFKMRRQRRKVTNIQIVLQEA
jgi:ribosomal protein L22